MLELRDLVRVLGGHRVLDGVSLRVAAGELFALVGPSGSGKTTLLRAVAGLDRLDAGRLYLAGADAAPLPSERRGAVMVFQQPLLFPHLTVADNVGFGLQMQGVPARQRAGRVAEALDRVHLAGLGQRFPTQLSGGQQQRVALARALVVQPRLLLLDEPFSHLDPGLRDDLRGLFRDLQRATGITTLLVTHDCDEALQLADRLGVLLAGRLVQAGPPDTVFTRPANRQVAAFMRAGNLVPGVIRNDGTFASNLGGGPLPARPGGWRRGQAWAVLAPQRLQVGPPGGGTPATVAGCYRDTGGPVLELIAAGQRLIARRSPLDPPFSWPAGAAVSLTWDSRQAWYVYDL